MAAEKDQQEDAGAEGLSATTLLPKLIPSGVGREWLERRRATIRPWGTFVDQRRFSRPRNVGELCQRLVRNVEYYQSNYVFVFLGLILYCVVTSPMLLVAIAVFFGACYILYLRTLQSKFVLFGCVHDRGGLVESRGGQAQGLEGAPGVQPPPSSSHCCPRSLHTCSSSLPRETRNLYYCMKSFDFSVSPKSNSWRMLYRLKKHNCRPRDEPRPSVCSGWGHLLSLLLAGWCRLCCLLGPGSHPRGHRLPRCLPPDRGCGR